MSDFIKVSVVLPVYNAGMHLYKCLDSLVNQTLKEIEIIAILDCPTDGSDKVVEEYAKKYPQINIVKNRENFHIGVSRNKGLEIARGKYVGFCDHDDYVDLRMYEILYNIMEEENMDLVVSPYVGIVNNKIIINDCYPLDYSPDNNKDVIFKTSIGVIHAEDPMRKFAYSGVIWNKLFKKEIIDLYNLRFVDTLISSPEDLLFFIEYVSYCKRVGVCHTNLYFHQLQIDNTGSSYDYNSPVKRLNGLIHLYNFLNHANYLKDVEAKHRFNNTLRCVCCGAFLVELKCNGWKSFIGILKLYKKQEFIRSSFAENFKTVFRDCCTIKRYVFLLFCKYLIGIKYILIDKD